MALSFSRLLSLHHSVDVQSAFYKKERKRSFYAKSSLSSRTHATDRIYTRSINYKNSVLLLRCIAEIPSRLWIRR